MTLSPAIHHERLSAPKLPKAKQKRPDRFYCSWGVYDLALHPDIPAAFFAWYAKIHAPAPLMLPAGPQPVALLTAPEPKPIVKTLTPRKQLKRTKIIMGSVRITHGVSRFAIYAPASLIPDVVDKALIYGRVETIDISGEYITVAVVEDMVTSREGLRKALADIKVERRAA